MNNLIEYNTDPLEMVVENPSVFITSISDNQASNIIKDYHVDKNFERNVNCYEFVKHLENALKNDISCCYLNLMS
jgi:hypothetical protein